MCQNNGSTHGPALDKDMDPKKGVVAMCEGSPPGPRLQGQKLISRIDPRVLGKTMLFGKGLHT